MSSITYEKGKCPKVRFAIHTLGCKVNSYESDRMAQHLTEAGFEMVDFEAAADIYIVNTCSVTNIADRKSRQILHRAKKTNPEAIIVAAGCYVESRHKDHSDEILSDGVDVLIGNKDKENIAEILTEYLKAHGFLAEPDMTAMEQESSEPEPAALQYCGEQLPGAGSLGTVTDHTRAYIKIQDGCNQFCTYCIIPYVRGRIKSRDLSEIVDEAKALSKAGFKEVVLTGIHVSSYGKDLGSGSLLTVIQAVHEVEGIDRIRLSSLEMGIITPELAGELAGLNKLCPHFHLSLQSGCTDTLKRMNRHYTPEEYAASVRYLREAFHEKRGAYPAITTDVITGFPGESEEDFEESRRFVESIGFFETHIFKYSKRQGTTAAKMKGQLTDRVKSERSSVLIAMNEKNRARYIEGVIGEKDYLPALLIEEETVIEGERYQVGYTAEYIRCAVKSEEDLKGKILTGRIILSDLHENGRQICIMDEFEVK